MLLVLLLLYWCCWCCCCCKAAVVAGAVVVVLLLFLLLLLLLLSPFHQRMRHAGVSKKNTRFRNFTSDSRTHIVQWNVGTVQCTQSLNAQCREIVHIISFNRSVVLWFCAKYTEQYRYVPVLYQMYRCHAYVWQAWFLTVFHSLGNISDKASPFLGITLLGPNLPASVYLFSVYRIRIHWTRIRIPPKISIRIRI